ncbi:unnamed protein product [Brugia timori]|uniref:Uncharacterized protein n=1 Tax=Brugia timori TaxID=42155 RepID=A0A3P7UIB9_9BILA|nr:unnamed protein product [Brugia timori]
MNTAHQTAEFPKSIILHSIPSKKKLLTSTVINKDLYQTYGLKHGFELLQLDRN